MTAPMTEREALLRKAYAAIGYSDPRIDDRASIDRHVQKDVEAVVDAVVAAVGSAQVTPNQHDATYLRGWNEGIERAIELLDADGWCTPPETIRNLLEPSPLSPPTQEGGE